MSLPTGPRRPDARRRAEHGQAMLLLVAVLCAALLGAYVLAALAQGVGAHGREQRAADLGALAGARAMRDLHARLFAPPVLGGRPNPQHIELAGYLAAGRRAAEAVARANGAQTVVVSFPDPDPIAPVVIRVSVAGSITVRFQGAQRAADVRASADAELAPEVAPLTDAAVGDEYRGPLAYRQGKPMRPDVARAFDRMQRAAEAAGVHLVVVSGWRSNAERARLFAARPDPTWVAPPGRSLHRLGTELDLGPSSAYGWLAANASRFGFVKRYAWEPWHFGYTLNAGSDRALSRRRGGEDRPAIPSFVPARYVGAISRAAQRWNVSATLLAAQLYQESGFNPFARSGAGAQGIAQFIPSTATAYGLRNPFDPVAAIDAQAHLMRDLLRQFGSVALALAAYNAGPGAVQGCGCVPPIPETLAYVAAILGLMRGAGDAGMSGLEVRLVR